MHAQGSLTPRRGRPALAVMSIALIRAELLEGAHLHPATRVPFTSFLNSGFTS